MENSLENNNIELHEKVAALEANQITLANNQVSLNNTLDKIEKKVNSIYDDMNRYKGYLGAFTFFGSCIVVMISLFKDWLLNHWK